MCSHYPENKNYDIYRFHNIKSVQSANYYYGITLLFRPLSMADSASEKHPPLLLGEWVTEMATVAVRTRGSVDDHSADLGFVAWVSYHRTELVDSVSELAVIAVRTVTGLLPFVAELRLRHPLTVNLKLQRIFLSFSGHTHLLWYLHRSENWESEQKR